MTASTAQRGRRAASSPAHNAGRVVLTAAVGRMAAVAVPSVGPSHSPRPNGASTERRSALTCWLACLLACSVAERRARSVSGDGGGRCSDFVTDAPSVRQLSFSSVPDGSPLSRLVDRHESLLRPGTLVVTTVLVRYQ